MNKKKENSSLYILLFVGVVSAFGPFVTDFYLPALPTLGKYFSTSASMIQLTLTVSMIGLAIGQLFIGPLSDRYGRKRLLIISLSLFIISTAGCLIINRISEFLFFRFIQGIAGAGGVVISKSIATDLYTGKRLTHFFSILSSVQGLAPICAPVLGGAMLMVTDWRGIFGILLLLGVALLLAIIPFKESLRNPTQGHLYATFKNYLPVIGKYHFMRYVLIQSMAMGVMFAYIAASPFIYQQYYGLSAFSYSLCFGLNALGVMAGSLFVARFQNVEKILKFGSGGFLLMALMVASLLLCNSSIYSLEFALFVLLVCLGTILPSSTTLALEPMRNNSGNASAILGFFIFLVGGICSPLAGLGNMIVSTSIIIPFCALCTFVLAMINYTPLRIRKNNTEKGKKSIKHRHQNSKIE